MTKVNNRISIFIRESYLLTHIHMKINKEWHEQHLMPKNPSIEQRIEWHLEHLKHCHCRELPEKLKEEMIKRHIKIPLKKML